VEIGFIFEVMGDKSLADLSAVENNFHPSNAVILGQEIDRFLASFKLIDD